MSKEIGGIASNSEDNSWLKDLYEKVEFLDNYEFDIFVQKLELISGDEILRSSIHKFIEQCKKARNK